MEADRVDIIQTEYDSNKQIFHRGIWNVPYVGEVYLIKADVFREKPLSFVNGALDPDMALCKNLRERVRSLLCRPRSTVEAFFDDSQQSPSITLVNSLKKA